MLDSIQRMFQFYRDIDSLYVRECSVLAISDQLDKAAKVAMQLDSTMRMNKASIDAVYESVRKLVPPDISVFVRLANQETQWVDRMQSILAVTKTESLIQSFQNSLMAQEMAQLKVMEALSTSSLLTKNAALAARLFAPHDVYADFASATAVRLAQATLPASASAFRASLRLAEVQLITTSEAISRVVRFGDITELTATFEDEPCLIVPLIQQQELLDADVQLDDVDTDTLIETSPAARTAEVANRILILVTKCNEASCVAGKGNVFKPTTRMLEAFTQLPWELAKDKKALANIVDCLFWILYEGAGDDKLRYLQDNGGWMDPTECDSVFHVKFLRNKWLRHDPDHGRTSKILKGWADVSEVLREFGLNHLPTTEADLRMLHYSMLRKVETFLGDLLTRITSQGT